MPDGEDFQKFWNNGDTLQLAGKDQVRFQSVMWQAMLMSADVKTTNCVLYHGFINSGGQKMSKSLGNVISPADLVARYGTEATRYLLLRHVHPFEDTDITFERLDEWYNAHLVNGLGNLVARVMKMAETHLTTHAQLPSYGEDQKKYLEKYEIQKELDFTWTLIGELDEYIQVEQPFKVIKSDVEKGRAHIILLVQKLSVIAKRLIPIMPQTAKKILTAIQENKKPENLFARKE